MSDSSTVPTPALPPSDWQASLVKQQDQLTSIVAAMAEKLNKLSAAVSTPKVAQRKAKKVSTPVKSVPESYVVVLQKDGREILVVEREPRSGGPSGSPRVGRRSWPTEMEAQSFWRSMSPSCSYKFRQWSENWNVVSERYNPKKHDNLPTQFRAKHEAIRPAVAA